jgi:hypothetical protein
MSAECGTTKTLPVELSGTTGKRVRCRMADNHGALVPTGDPIQHKTVSVDVAGSGVTVTYEWQTTAK